MKALTSLLPKEWISIPLAEFTNFFEIIIGMGRFPNLIIRIYNVHAKIVAVMLDSVAIYQLILACLF